MAKYGKKARSSVKSAVHKKKKARLRAARARKKSKAKSRRSRLACQRRARTGRKFRGKRSDLMNGLASTCADLNRHRPQP
jgi:hypothetical protein